MKAIEPTTAQQSTLHVQRKLLVYMLIVVLINNLKWISHNSYHWMRNT